MLYNVVYYKKRLIRYFCKISVVFCYFFCFLMLIYTTPMRISLLTVLVSPLTMRLNWEAETPIFSASSFCVMWFPLHKSEIRCPGVPGKAIDTHLLRILPLYRMIAKMQFPKCKLHQNAILAIFRELHFFRVDLG